jgi:NADH:ubiquinone oxidoreductase subunit K
MLPIHAFLVTITSLLAIGLYALSVKRNMIRLLLAIGIIFNAANFAFITMASHRYGYAYLDPLAQSIVLLAMILESCILAIGLTIMISAYKIYKTLDVRELSRLKW